MGTFVTLTAAGADASKAQDAFARAFVEMERLVAVFDRRIAGSALGVLNDQGRLSDSPPELTQVLGAASRIGLASDNAFNPAIAPVIDLLAERKQADRKIGLSDRDFAEAMVLGQPGLPRLDGSRIRLPRAEMRLTLDGIAKGFIADAASRTLLAEGIANHMVNAGGDIRVQGYAASGQPWSIGVRHPKHKNGVLAAVPVASGGIATSGSYEQSYGKKHSHLINSLIGMSSDIASVTVRASTAMEADALATAASLMPATAACVWIEKQGASCLIVDAHDRVVSSTRWG